MAMANATAASTTMVVSSRMASMTHGRARTKMTTHTTTTTTTHTTTMTRGGRRGRRGATTTTMASGESEVFRAWDLATKSQKRTDIKKIMILGAGPIVIGQVR